jgi:hypothetical protein
MAPPYRRKVAAVPPFLAAAIVLAAALFPRPALAHDWQGAATPDCECLPHFKLDCKDLAPVQKAWGTLVARRCNETLASSAEQTQGVSFLADAAAAAAKAPAPAHSGHQAAEDGDGDAPAGPAFRCQVDQACYEAYHVVIGHHYGCPPAFLPANIGAGIHYYQTPAPSTVPNAPETICAGCFQPRYVIKGAPLCPKLNCHDNEGALLGNLTLASELGCEKECGSDACKRAYQFLSVHHDGCVLNDNPLASRAGADALRSACAPRHECAFSNGTYAAGTWKVDCGAEKNAGPFKALKAPGPVEEEEKVLEEGAKEAADHAAHGHSAHDHGAAPPSAPSAVAASGACRATVGACASVLALVAALMLLLPAC